VKYRRGGYNMCHKLFVGILGKPNAGKSETIRALVGRKVRSGKHSIKVGEEVFIEAYIFVSSPQERGFNEEQFKSELEGYKIVICTIQYPQSARQRYKIDPIDTLHIAKNEGYELKIFWINPGYGSEEYTDERNIIYGILRLGGSVSLLDANREDPNVRAEKLRRSIKRWVLDELIKT